MSSGAKRSRRPDLKLLEQIAKSQEEIDIINIEASKEILKVVASYHNPRLYQKRNELIKRVSNFWGTAFNNQKVFGLLAMEKECLRSLSKLEVMQFSEVQSGYRIIFHFTENPYFENKVLTKEIHLRNAIFTSTPIKWKEGKNLLLPKSYKKEKKPISLSFFDWYLDNTSPCVENYANFIKDVFWEDPLYYYYRNQVEPEDEKDNGNNNDDEGKTENEEDDDK